MPLPATGKIPPATLALIAIFVACVALHEFARPQPGLMAQYRGLASPSRSAPPLLTRVERAPTNRRFADLRPHAIPERFEVSYSGRLLIRHAGTYLLWLEANGPAEVRIDSIPRAAAERVGGPEPFAYFELAKGLHTFEIDYRFDGTNPEPPLLSLSWSKDVSAPRPFPPATLYANLPSPWRLGAMTALRIVLLLLVLRAALGFAKAVLSPPGLRRLSFAAASAAAGVLISLLAGESFVRLARIELNEYIPGNIWMRYKGMEEPGATTLYMGWLPYNVKEFESPVTMNATGWRDLDYAYEKPDGVFRVVVLGDSYVEAKEVSLQATFHKRLETMLNESASPPARRFEVIALGRGGAATGAAYQFLFETGLLYDPDLVVLCFFPGNDVMGNSPELLHAHEDWLKHVYQEKIVPSKIAFIDRFLWIEASALNRFFVDRLAALYTSRLYLFRPDLSREQFVTDNVEVYTRGEYTPAWSEAWKNTHYLIESTRELAMTHGADFLLALVFSPQASGVDPQDLESGPWDLRRPHRDLIQFCAERGFDVLDLEPPLTEHYRTSGERYYWRYDAHWNETGHEIVARALFDYLRPRLGL